MSSRFPIGLVIAIFVVVAIIVSLRFVPPISLGNMSKVSNIENAPSDIAAQLTIRYDKPPLYEEEYRMRDDNGVSSYQYSLLRYAGPLKRVRLTLKAPPHLTYDVSFFFGELTSDGVWDIPSRPPRGDTSVSYTVSVQQTEAYHGGSHSATFTDPKFWATSAGREFHIHLSPTGPLPNILQLQGTGIKDARYLHILEDFRTFGPPEFRSAVEKARAQALATHV